MLDSFLHVQCMYIISLIHNGEKATNEYPVDRVVAKISGLVY